MKGAFDRKNNFSLFISKKDNQAQEGELVDDEIFDFLSDHVLVLQTQELKSLNHIQSCNTIQRTYENSSMGSPSKGRSKADYTEHIFKGDNQRAIYTNNSNFLTQDNINHTTKDGSFNDDLPDDFGIPSMRDSCKTNILSATILNQGEGKYFNDKIRTFNMGKKSLHKRIRSIQNPPPEGLLESNSNFSKQADLQKRSSIGNSRYSEEKCDDNTEAPYTDSKMNSKLVLDEDLGSPDFKKRSQGEAVFFKKKENPGPQKTEKDASNFYRSLSSSNFNSKKNGGPRAYVECNAPLPIEEKNGKTQSSKQPPNDKYPLSKKYTAPHKLKIDFFDQPKGKNFEENSVIESIYSEFPGGNKFGFRNENSLLEDFRKKLTGKESLIKEGTLKSKQTMEVGGDHHPHQDEFSVDNYRSRSASNRNVFENQLIIESELNISENKTLGEQYKELLLDKNLDSALAILNTGITTEEINQKDAIGNNLFLLTLKESNSKINQLYYEIIKKLLELGADPSIKDKYGWGAMDELVFKTDVFVAALTFEYLHRKKKERIELEKINLIQTLKNLPDFYLEIKWEFESNVIPFVSKIAPSDTFKLWKSGESFRLDYAFVGFKGLKSKKREMSVVFNPSKVPDKKGISKFNRRSSLAFLWIINRPNKFFTNPLQDVDFEEKKAILKDLLCSQPVQGDLNLLDCKLSEKKNWFGNQIKQDIGPWKTKRFEFQVTLSYNLRKKKHRELYNNYSEYVKIINEIEHKGNIILTQDSGIIEDPDRKNPNQKESANDFIKKMKEAKIVASESKEKKIKKHTLSMWLTKDYPLSYKELIPLFQFLGKGNDMMNQMNSLLNKENLQNLMVDNGFPVKLQFPISFSIKANISFSSMKKIELTQAEKESIFEIPKEFTYQDRKVAQKILIRPKKRLILANMII